MHCEFLCWACQRRCAVFAIERVVDDDLVRYHLCTPCWRRAENGAQRRLSLVAVVERAVLVARLRRYLRSVLSR